MDNACVEESKVRTLFAKESVERPSIQPSSTPLLQLRRWLAVDPA
jgi:hypothetical protein